MGYIYYWDKIYKAVKYTYMHEWWSINPHNRLQSSCVHVKIITTVSGEVPSILNQRKVAANFEISEAESLVKVYCHRYTVRPSQYHKMIALEKVR